jgi:hypothetical protein
MANTATIRASAFTHAQERTAAVPWYVYSLLIASASAVVGAHWDVAWHNSVGRDTFWTPAHLLIQFCAVLGAFTCIALILRTTFGHEEAARQASVSVLGFRGALGTFVVMWGAAALLASAPFDNWWHEAYGLDVKILSPPHVVAGLGASCVQLGGLLLILGCMNRAEGTARRRLDWLFLCAGGLVLCQVVFFSFEYTFSSFMHSAIFYRAISIAVPLILIGVAYASERRWAATTVAAVYTILVLGEKLVLRLFPAEPKLGPVYNKITHFVSPFFPLLVIAAAICVDLVRPWIRERGRWFQATVLGSVFLAVMVAVQWPFATFLLSPASRNWFFGTGEFGYSWRPEWATVRHVFVAYEPTRAGFALGMVIALGCAILSTRLGLGWAKWMRAVRR